MEERLQMILNYYALTGGKFAEIIGVQKSSISHILSGRNKPSFEFTAKILSNFRDVNPDWLILGEGSMLKDKHIEMEASVQGTSYAIPDQDSKHKWHNDKDNDKDIGQHINKDIDRDIPNSTNEAAASRPRSQRFDENDAELFTNVNKRDLSEKEVKQLIILYHDNTFDIIKKNTQD